MEAAQRAADEAGRGRAPGQERPPRGGTPYKRAYGEPEARMLSNVTDPDSRIMKSSAEGFQHCSNAETVVDETHPIIVGSVVGSSGRRPGLACAAA